MSFGEEEGGVIEDCGWEGYQIEGSQQYDQKLKLAVGQFKFTGENSQQEGRGEGDDFQRPDQKTRGATETSWAGGDLSYKRSKWNYKEDVVTLKEAPGGLEGARCKIFRVEI
jgi:hypothetical protein